MVSLSSVDKHVCVCLHYHLTLHAVFVVYGQMDVRLNLIDIFRQLDKETRQFWVDLVNSYLLNSKYVTVSFLLYY